MARSQESVTRLLDKNMSSLYNKVGFKVVWADVCNSIVVLAALQSLVGLWLCVASYEIIIVLVTCMQC